MRKVIILIALFTCLYTNANAAVPTRQYTYTTGETIDPDHVTANEDELYSYTSAGIEEIKDGYVDTADFASDIEFSGAKFTSLASVQAGAGILPSANAPATQFYIDSFQRTMTTASGNQTITGVGFTPTLVILIGNVSSTAAAAIGFDDGTDNYAIMNVFEDTADQWSGSTVLTNLLVGSGAGQNIANSVTFNTDGFVVPWVKQGSPTGTANLYFIAFR